MNDYIVYLILFALAIFEYYIFYIEPRLLKTEICRIYTGKDSLKIIQLSDLHLNDLKVRLEDINKVIDKEAPDAIAITGDMLDKPDDLVYLDNFLTSLSYSCPVYLTLGNHDIKVIRTMKEIEDLKTLLRKFPGITLLHNETASITKGSRMFDIIGLPDTQSEHYSGAKTNEMIIDAKNIKIVLSHNPDAAGDIFPGSCYCIISGHLHGGQIRLPFNFEFSVLRKDRLPKKGFKKGLYKVNKNLLYISRGIGTSFIPARFLSRPEITVFYL